MPRNRGNTRDEILTVAMRLFVDHGYDKTSLREIADEIGVTKAALYYHFRTKEDIVRSAMRAHVDRVSEVAEWLERRPVAPGRNEELVDRLMAAFSGEAGMAMRFGQTNPTVMSRDEFSEQHLKQIARLLRLISGENAGPDQTIRAVGAFGALTLASIDPAPGGPVSIPGTPEERRAAGRRIALEVLNTIEPGSS